MVMLIEEEGLECSQEDEIPPSKKAWIPSDDFYIFYITENFRAFIFSKNSSVLCLQNLQLFLAIVAQNWKNVLLI